MGSRRRRPSGDDAVVKAVFGLVLMVALLLWTHPQVVAGLMEWGFVILVGGGAVLAIVMILRFRVSDENPRQSQVNTFHFSTQPQSASAQAPEVSYQDSQPRLVVAPPDSTPRAVTHAELREMDWFQFEKVVAALYEARGNRVERRGGANPDGGIDLVLCREEKRAAVQCKHWKTWKVGVGAVREFFGGMKAEGFDRGIFIALSGCTREAKAFAGQHGISVLDAHEVQAMLAQLEPGPMAAIRRIVDDPTKHCPKCGSPMVRRIAERGPNPGSQFWGCSTYPRCKGKMQLAGDHAPGRK